MYARQLQLWDYMLTEDVAMLPGEDFKLFTRPEGERCLLLSGNGVTIARDSRGFVLAKFASGLPGGHPQETIPSGDISVLDCIFNKQV